MQPSLFSASPIEAAFARQNAHNATIPTNAADGPGEGAGGEGSVAERDAHPDGGEITDACNHPRKRKLQQVVTISDRIRVIQRMLEDAEVNGEKGLILRTIAKFPNQFRGQYNVSLL